MLIMKLNLPTETVTYNKVGKRVSTPVPHTPEKIKATTLNLEVTGYVSDSLFIAYDLKSPDREFSLADKCTLLRTLGFKTVPVKRVPTGTDGEINELITQLIQYQEFSPRWWSIEGDCEYKLPELRSVTSISWGIDAAGRLVKVLETNQGTYKVIDHRTPEYYQPGSTIKVQGDKVMPFKSSAIIEHTPSFCPVCNNPLTRMQVAVDTPLIFKCKSPICPKLRVTDEPVPAATPDNAAEETSFREPESQSTAKDTENREDVLVTSGTAAPKTMNVFSFDVDLTSLELNDVEVLTDADKLEESNCDYLIVKSKRSITRVTRKTAERLNIPMLTVEELQNLKN